MKRIEKEVSNVDDTVVCVGINSMQYFVSVEDGIALMRILGRAEYRYYHYKAGNYTDGYNMIRPVEHGTITVQNANMVQVFAERLMYKDYQAEELKAKEEVEKAA